MVVSELIKVLRWFLSHHVDAGYRAELTKINLFFRHIETD